VICAGGGGIPVCLDRNGDLKGVEVVVDKAYTTGLLASEIEADAMIFVSVQERIERLLQHRLNATPVRVPLAEMDGLIEQVCDLDEDLYAKLIASRSFLQRGGKWVLLTPPNPIGQVPDGSGGVCFVKSIP
jgi:carbamate kinase